MVDSNGAAGCVSGKLGSNETVAATLYALKSLSARGTLLVAPGNQVYPGMVIGESAKVDNLEVNPVQTKSTNNMRLKGKEEKIYLSPLKRMSVDELIWYMNEDDVIEVMPLSVRLRKLELDSGARERLARIRKKQVVALKPNKKGERSNRPTRCHFGT